MARVRDFDGVGRVLTRSHREGISFFSLQTYAHLRDLFIHLPAVVSPASNAISCIPKQHAQFTKKCWDKRVEIFATYVQAHKGSAQKRPGASQPKKKQALAGYKIG